MKGIQDNQGYTLVELLIALLITLVLGGVLFSVYLSSIRYVEPWRREVSLENHTHLIVQRLATDLAHAEQLIDEGNKTWTLTFVSGRMVRYSYQDSVLMRNDRRMHDSLLSAVAFHLVPSRLETRYALRRRESVQEDERSLIQVQIHLALQSRERTLDVTTTTAMRQPRPWYPLPFDTRP